MKTQELKRIMRILKKVYEELDIEAVKNGADLSSENHELMMAAARESVLSKFGYTVEQYREAKEQLEREKQAVETEKTAKIEELESKIESIKVPTAEEISTIARSVAEEIAQKYVVAPTVTNQIVKEVTIEKPRIIETVRNTTVKETYNDKPLREEISKVAKKVDEIKPFDPTELKEEIANNFEEQFKQNIDTLGMPDFRKLGMGLQAQIDNKVTSYTTHTLTVSATQPSNPQLLDLWLDIA